MAVNLGGQSVLILKEGAERSTGKDAQRNNIAAARAISESIRSALGPRGLDKMLVDGFGDVVITNDGATILKEMEVQHPVAKFMVELAKAMDDEVGDGTTTVVVLAGELLKHAEDLLDEDVHPQILVEGYRKASEKAFEFLKELANQVDPKDKSILKQIARTSMNSKVISTSGDYLSDLVVEAVTSVVDEDDKADLDDIKVEKKEGENLDATKLIKGIVLDKEVVHTGMPRDVKDAKIALVAEAIEISKTEFDAEFSITDPTQIQSFVDRETEIIKEMVDKIVETGASVLLTSKGIDDIAQHLLAKAGILAVRRIKKSDMEKLSKATNARVVTKLNDISVDDLGNAGKVHEVEIGDDKMIYVEECETSKSVTILIRGGTELVIDEADRAIHDALCVVRNVVNEPDVVVGGGAPEMSVSTRLKSYADSLTGREQLAVKAFSQALEVIPRTLAENTGLDPIDIMAELKQKQSEKSTYGVDPKGKQIKDFDNIGVIEPLAVKRQAISSATEAATMILRIDDIISAKDLGGGGPGMPPGGGGEDMDLD
ncbi:MAG: thermosome subunit beta [Candidatus Hodarchaeales archaeon]|jgi:thermosome